MQIADGEVQLRTYRL